MYALSLLFLVSSAFAQDAPPPEEKERPAEPSPAPEDPQQRPAEPEPEQKERPADPAPPPTPAPPEVPAPPVLPAEPVAVPEPIAAAAPLPESVDDLFKRMDELPPDKASALAVMVGFGAMPYWTEQAPPWPSIGFRYHAGVVTNGTMIGGGAQVMIEGPIPEHYLIGLEPMFTIDHIGGGLQVGASAGVGLNLYGAAALRGAELTYGVVPGISARVGYSQDLSRVSRRFFVLAEPRLRYDFARPSVSALLVIGQGRGS